MLIQELSPAAALGFQLANEFAEQLITLSTGVLAISITFLVDRPELLTRRGWLRATWVLHLVSILCGVLAMSSITGQLLPRGGLAVPLSNVNQVARNFATYQLLTFFAGMGTITVFGFGVFSHVVAPGAAAGAGRRRRLSILADALRARLRRVQTLVPADAPLPPQPALAVEAAPAATADALAASAPPSRDAAD